MAALVQPGPPRYDVIVIGLGAMGSAALDQLARRGLNVLGLEQFGIPHDLGSSGGDTRLIRKAYFEHPDYVPLLERAYTNWADLEARTGEQVLYRTGTVYIGPPECTLIAGSERSAKMYGLECAELSGQDVAARWPALEVPAGYRALREPEGGFVLAGKSIRLFAELALRRGAQVRAAERVVGWRETKDGIEVTTTASMYRGGRLIVTAGSWASSLLPELPTTLSVTRQALFWLWPENTGLYELDRFTCWGAEVKGRAGMLYGFPMLPTHIGGQLGLKVALHVPGQPTVPGQMRPIDVAEFAPVREALATVFPGDLGPVVAAKACMYTSSVDHHFIVDRYPGSERVIIACGFSGHGFKFASVIGEALADLAAENRTNLPIGFLSLDRLKTQQS